MQIIFFKHRYNTTTSIHEESIDTSYSTPIIEALDAIILDKWIPSKTSIKMCRWCRHSIFCWGGVTLDLTKVKIGSLEEAEESWLKGRYYKTLGKSLKDQSADFINAFMGEHLAWVGEKLQASRSSYPRKSIDISKYIQVHGTDHLKKVLNITDVDKLNIREL